MIPDTLPNLDAITAEWRQGDVADVGTIRWFGDPRRPLTPETQEAAERIEGDTILVSAAAEGLVVVTQTCDVVRSSADRPFVTLAPLVRLPETAAREARMGMRPRYAHVPLLGPDAFADLDVVLTVEKSLLGRWQRRAGWAEDADARKFGRSVARKYARFAFPDDLSRALGPFIRRVRRHHGRDTAEGRALDALEEIRVTGAPSWASTAIAIFLIFAPPTRADADSVLSPDEWDELVDAWLEECERQGVITAVDGAMVPLDELTARQYLDSDILDLDRLTA